MGERRIILASQSPRRKELLSMMRLKFETEVSQAEEEKIHGESAENMVLRLSRLKAEAVSEKHPDAVVIAADTVVTLDGEILGKPRDSADAVRMLLMLSGRRHDVLTGVTVTGDGRTVSFAEKTSVSFVPFGRETAERYVMTGEPDDKAGSYGIQGIGGTLICGIEGDYYNVMGLPICKLRETLRQFNISVL